MFFKKDKNKNNNFSKVAALAQGHEVRVGLPGLRDLSREHIGVLEDARVWGQVSGERAFAVDPHWLEREISHYGGDQVVLFAVLGFPPHKLVELRQEHR